MDRETIEITAGAIAAVLFAISELLALSKQSDCNSVSQVLANAARCLRPADREAAAEEEPPTTVVV